MSINEIIESTGITKTHLAKKMGMNESTFKNKLSETHSARFSIGEIDQLNKVIGEISLTLRNYLTSQV